MQLFVYDVSNHYLVEYFGHMNDVPMLLGRIKLQYVIYLFKLLIKAFF